MRDNIRDIVCKIDPYDNKEQQQRQNVLDWIDSDAPLYRISKPSNPPVHLVSYFVLHDCVSNKIMLIDHLKSGLKLPAGGHLDINEDPWVTVVRESQEELKINAEPDPNIGRKPLFITTTITIGQNNHTDVSLWYVIKGDSTCVLDFDRREMSGYEWLSPNEILHTDIMTLDPEMHRFTNKLVAELY